MGNHVSLCYRPVFLLPCFGWTPDVDGSGNLVLETKHARGLGALLVHALRFLAALAMYVCVVLVLWGTFGMVSSKEGELARLWGGESNIPDLSPTVWSVCMLAGLFFFVFVLQLAAKLGERGGGGK